MSQTTECETVRLKGFNTVAVDIKTLAIQAIERNRGVSTKPQFGGTRDTALRLSCDVFRQDGRRESQNHLLRSGPDWEAWLERWQPPKGAPIQ